MSSPTWHARSLLPPWPGRPTGQLWGRSAWVVIGFWLILGGVWTLVARDRHRLESELQRVAAASLAATLQAQRDSRTGDQPPAALAAVILQTHARSLAQDVGELDLTVVNAVDGSVVASSSDPEGSAVQLPPGVTLWPHASDGMDLTTSTPVAGTPWRVAARVPPDGRADLVLMLLGLMGLLFTLLAVRLAQTRLRRLQERRDLQAQWRSVECMEERTLRTQQRFFSAVSHELRTPLNILLGFSELLQLAPDGPETGRFARLVHDSGKQLLRRVNTLLDLARLDAGRLPLQMVRVHATDLALDAVDRHRAAAQAKGLALQGTASGAGAVSLLTDAQRYVQILDELLGNAVKFTTQGWILLECSLDGDWLAITVTDTGCGIVQDRLDTVFERFTSPDGQQHVGCGLGLCLSRQLAHLLGGSLCLESTMGQGTRVRLRLPLSGGINPAAGTTAPTASPPGSPAAQRPEPAPR